MTAIHPTAIVDPAARLGAGVRIGPASVVTGAVTLGDNVVIGPQAVIGVAEGDDGEDPVEIGAGSVIGTQAIICGEVSIGANSQIGRSAHLVGRLRLGKGCLVFDHAVLGNPGQYPGRHERHGLIEIGDGVVLREQVCVTQPVTSDLTCVGDGSYLMARTQVDHDCRLGRFVKTASGTTLGGNVSIGDHAYLGMNAVVHQRIRIGAHAMVGMNGVVTRDVPPYAVFIERRARRVNAYGLRLRGVSDTDIEAIERSFAALEQGLPPTDLDADNPLLVALMDFLVAPGTDAIAAFRGPGPSLAGKAAFST